MAECVVTRIEKESMIAALHNEPEFSAVFIAYLLARNSRIEDDLVDQLFNSSERRLARLLLLLANFGKEGKPEPIVGKFSQETLAEMIGTTRARVSFFMNKFRKLGFIEYNGKLEVHTSLLNMVLHDNPKIEKTNSWQTPERCPSGLRRAHLLGVYARASGEPHRLDDVCASARRSIRFLRTNPASRSLATASAARPVPSL
jgi:Crp-like helix-turn-helix domain